jgi:hypothetical protein
LNKFRYWAVTVIPTVVVHVPLVEVIPKLNLKLLPKFPATNHHPDDIFNIFPLWEVLHVCGCHHPSTVGSHEDTL